MALEYFSALNEKIKEKKSLVMLMMIMWVEEKEREREARNADDTRRNKKWTEAVESERETQCLGAAGKAN